MVEVLTGFLYGGNPLQASLDRRLENRDLPLLFANVFRLVAVPAVDIAVLLRQVFQFPLQLLIDGSESSLIEKLKITLLRGHRLPALLELRILLRLLLRIRWARIQLIDFLVQETFSILLRPLIHW